MSCTVLEFLISLAVMSEKVTEDCSLAVVELTVILGVITVLVVSLGVCPEHICRAAKRKRKTIMMEAE